MLVNEQMEQTAFENNVPVVEMEWESEKLVPKKKDLPERPI